VLATWAVRALAVSSVLHVTRTAAGRLLFASVPKRCRRFRPRVSHRRMHS